MNPADDSDEFAGVDYAKLSRIATTAVLDLWDGERQTFARSTIDRPPEKLRPTVTFRCVDVLVTALRTQVKGAEEWRPAIEAAARLAATTTPEDAKQCSDLDYPSYTLALLTLATAQVAELGGEVGGTAKDNVDRAVDALIEALETAPAPAHPFVQDHALRALIAARPLVAQPATADSCAACLVASVRNSALGTLAKHHMALLSPAEAVVLAFSAAALSTTGDSRDDKIALAALAAAASAQDASGSWPLGRVVQEEPGRLEISTYEVAWTTTATLERLLLRKACDINDPDTMTIVAAVANAGRFAERSIIEPEKDLHGWASDHPYQSPRVESWTSAIVLQFILASRDLRDDIRNRRVLATFSSRSPQDDSWPEWVNWDDLHVRSEPDQKHPIYAYIDKRVIAPIEADPRGLPSGSSETASVLLFGPPGTSKTTIAQAVAQRLDWPIVSLSPGTFIEKGLEAIEAEARSVFDRLQQLRRVVVLFDECDELFRDRKPSEGNQLRNISAFVTASMLPKLQDLHDRGQVLFVICTNHVCMMDPAVLRGGRMDHRIGVGPPDRHARALIIDGMKKPPGVPHREAALNELVRSADRFSRSELVRAAKKLMQQAEKVPWDSSEQAAEAAEQLVQSMSDSLTISDDLMAQFGNDQSKWSDPVLLGAS